MKDNNEKNLENMTDEEAANLRGTVKFYVNVLTQKVMGVYSLADKYDPDKEIYFTNGSEELRTYQKEHSKWKSELKYNKGLEDYLKKKSGKLNKKFTELTLYINKETGKPSFKESKKDDKKNYKLSIYVSKEAKNKVDSLLRKRGVSFNSPDDLSPDDLYPYVTALLDATLLYGHKRKVLSGEPFGLVYGMKDIIRDLQRTLGIEDKQGIYRLYRNNLKVNPNTKR